MINQVFQDVFMEGYIQGTKHGVGFCLFLGLAGGLLWWSDVLEGANSCPPVPVKAPHAMASPEAANE